MRNLIAFFKIYFFVFLLVTWTHNLKVVIGRAPFTAMGSWTCNLIANAVNKLLFMLPFLDFYCVLRKCAHQAELSFALHICVCFAIYVCSTSNFFNKIKWFKNRRLRFLVQMYYLFYILEWSAGLISMTFYNFLFSCWIWTAWDTFGFLHLSLLSHLLHCTLTTNSVGVGLEVEKVGENGDGIYSSTLYCG